MRGHLVSRACALASGLLGLVGLIFIFGFDPDQLGSFGLTLFFLVLGGWVASLVAWGLTLLALHSLGEERARVFVGSLLRQALLLGVGVAALAALRFFDYLLWWNALLLIAFCLLLELSLRGLSRASLTPTGHASRGGSSSPQ